MHGCRVVTGLVYVSLHLLANEREVHHVGVNQHDCNADTILYSQSVATRLTNVS